MLCFSIFFHRYLEAMLFPENEEPYSFYVHSGSSKCCYFVGFSYDSGNTRFSQVRFDGKSCALVGPKSSKHWKSSCESDNSFFLCFSDNWDFTEKCENHEILKL